jgi:hypothetical protein
MLIARIDVERTTPTGLFRGYASEPTGSLMLNLRSRGNFLLTIAATAGLLFTFSCAKDTPQGSQAATGGPGQMGPNHAMGPGVEHDASMPMPDGGHMR